MKSAIEWISWVPHNFYVQHNGIWMWGLWEMIRGMSGTSGGMKETPESPLIPGENTVRRQVSMDQEVAPQQTLNVPAPRMVLNFSASRTMRNYFLLSIGHPVPLFCYRNPSRLQHNLILSHCGLAFFLSFPCFFFLRCNLTVAFIYFVG